MSRLGYSVGKDRRSNLRDNLKPDGYGRLVEGIRFAVIEVLEILNFM